MQMIFLFYLPKYNICKQHNLQETVKLYVVK